MIAENMRVVEERICAACRRAGRAREEVRLVCVSKTKPVSLLCEAYNAGGRLFGENRVQELMDKQPQLPGNIEWHMIGHLQKNKAKYLIGRAAMIHSVDSAPLAETISRLAVQAGTVMPVLIEVNAAGEETKFGISPENAETLVRELAVLPGIRVKGLMTIAPFTENPESNRRYFRLLRQLSIDIKRKSIDNIKINELSMGMTGDYEVAIEEGATLIRVGTGIFGER
ncbi:YggS family pyridoxal phosphate-dependent enzyme [Lachnoclostridium sp. Marseille-P6806]|uniref:YggS family pyridoxal phosphate-dependent enzyme n=1 Tax=Lachnoclostridium sp. Marseille-P6806 TaxID=2364793 RepID=UPI00103264AF|nr:YggS family pyridoxal phosphate-dependent enzyme [Lachnoclostridium sp. Marseille-P6806]